MSLSMELFPFFLSFWELIVSVQKCKMMYGMKVKVTQLCLSFYDPHGILQARILESGAFPFSRGSSQPRDRTQVFHIAGRFFTSWATRGKFKNTGVGSLARLQGVFLTQELNHSLLHCRWILYQLSYQGSPSKYKGYHIIFLFLSDILTSVWHS